MGYGSAGGIPKGQLLVLMGESKVISRAEFNTRFKYPGSVEPHGSWDPRLYLLAPD
jgi:hypothetical protein